MPMLIILALIFFCYLINQEALQQTKTAVLLMFSAALFIMGWRSVTYTGDNIAYAAFYQLNAQQSLQDAWNNVQEGNGKDPCFYLLGNVFSSLGFTYRGWFVFIAAVFLGGFCYLMYHRSRSYSLSMFFMITLGYFYFAMTGLRQAMAMGLCYIAFEFVCRRKFWWFLLFTFLAGLMHSSAFVFFIMYPLSFVKVDILKYAVLDLGALLAALLFPGLLGYLVQNFAWNEHLAAYGQWTNGLTISGYCIQSAILVFCLWAYYQKGEVRAARNNSPSNTAVGENSAVAPGTAPAFDCSKPTAAVLLEDNTLQCGLNALALGAALQAFAINIDNFFRIAMYFSAIAAFILPGLMERVREQEKPFVWTAVVAVCLWFMFHSRAFSHFTMFDPLPFTI